ncbi:MAG: UDP-N-acetylmuramoyl-L-alanyl-D-glutamate--2,6-diaminopimelate ligase [Lachnospiraceae bacterium]|nr:UDP-N-acetylmuramoyl-L-alanyl-D-glutamate--2,6-diaminopimelate ligase [Candidatus Equihabitans merdae]
MKLKKLLGGLDYTVCSGSVDVEISSVVFDSRKATEGSLFIAIVGAKTDGHRYLQGVIDQGAAAVLIQRGAELPADLDTKTCAVVEVPDTRYGMALVSAAWFDHPADKLKMIGITGTKGKTTTTYMVKSILENAGYQVGLIGTIEIIIGDKHIAASHTTPESYILQEYLHDMVEAGIEIVVMEVSSQALMLHRTAGIPFEIGVFTNIEPDHIGPAEHKDFDDYMNCKKLLFKQCRVGIFNGDDQHVNTMMDGVSCTCETFGIQNKKADLVASNIRHVNGSGSLGMAFDVSGLADLSVKLDVPGMFSVYNAMTAIAICRHFEIEDEMTKKALKMAKVKGRIEPVKVSDDFTLLIDYAHNAMALKSLLTTLRDYEPKRLVCLFGCGGNRARSRRFEMGEVSGNMADLTIITSDNPREEEPQAIIDDIKTGINKTSGKYVEIIDRREAIAYAIDNGQPGDIIVLAGKGHEDYQEINGVKYPMDERVIIEEYLKSR